VSELQFAVALVAGMLAVLNPCGFAMLPGYVALLVASGDDAPEAGRETRQLSAQQLRTRRLGTQGRTLGRALATATAMTGGFVVVFGGFGLIVTPFALSVEPYLPWVTVLVGLAMVGLGAWLLAGRDITLLLPKPTPGRPVRSLRWPRSTA
jgi:cytochrome c biogenesis protein CcdA